jgi:hypothetical protein
MSSYIDSEYIQKKIEEIKNADGDFERQHSMRDSLVKEVLTFIAEDHQLAQDVIKVYDLDFPEYTA